MDGCFTRTRVHREKSCICHFRIVKVPHFIIPSMGEVQSTLIRLMAGSARQTQCVVYMSASPHTITLSRCPPLPLFEANAPWLHPAYYVRYSLHPGSGT